MSDAQTESVEEVDNLDDAIMAELNALDDTPEPVEDEAPAEASEASEEAPEASESDEAPAEVVAEGEEQQPADDEPLRPYDHWREDYKETFSGMNRSQQEKWLEREREFENGFRQRSQELSQAKNFIGELHDIVQPVVNDWARQGIQPAAGIRRAIALEQALKENPQQALMELAQERGVDLQQTWAEQPYKDPAVVQLEQRLQEQERQNQEFMQQRQREQQERDEAKKRQAFAHLVSVRDAKDESGNLKFPHFADPLVVKIMTEELNAERAHSAEAAYANAMQQLRHNPAIRGFYNAQTQQVASARQAEAAKAKTASRSVESNSTGSTATPKSLDEDIMSALEAAGLQ